MCVPLESGNAGIRRPNKICSNWTSLSLSKRKEKLDNKLQLYHGSSALQETCACCYMRALYCIVERRSFTTTFRIRMDTRNEIYYESCLSDTICIRKPALFVEG